MIVESNKLALLYFRMFDFYICYKYDFVFFVLQICTQGLSEDAAWGFLFIFEEWFLLHFYHSNFLQ